MNDAPKSRPPESPEEAARLFEDLRDRERAAAKRATGYTLVPIMIAAVIMLVTANHMAKVKRETANARDAQQQAETAAQLAEDARSEAVEDLQEAQLSLQLRERQIEEIVRRLVETEQRLHDTESKLAAAADMTRHTHELSIRDPKEAYAHNPDPVVRVFTRMLELKSDVRFAWAGASMDEGFNSPAFAAYALRETLAGEFPEFDGPIPQVVEYLRDNLPEVETPEPGDLTIYPGGFVMLNVRDRDNQPFVIGMTPFGVLPLEPDFAPPESHRRWLQ